jgi:hypothetical protein
MAQKWEYQILHMQKMTDEQLGKALTELGKNGWEIAVGLNNGPYGTTTGIILKRPEDEKIPEITPQQRQQWTNERANSNEKFTESEMEDICRAFK